MNPNDYCQQQVLTPGSNLYYSLLYTSPEKRQAFAAIHSSLSEVQQVTYHQTEPQLTESKLQWWQQQLAQSITGTPTHPATIALQQAIKTYQLPTALLEEFIEGVKLRIQTDHLCHEKDLVLYGYREQGIKQILCAYVCGFQDQKSIQAIHHLGVAVTIVDILCHLRRDLATDLLLIPLDDLASCGIEPPQLTDTQYMQAAQKVFALQAKRARKYFQQAQDCLPNVDRYTLHPIILYGYLMMTLLDEIEKAQFPILTQKIALTPLRKLWIAWSYHRHTKKHYRQKTKITKKAPTCH